MDTRLDVEVSGFIDGLCPPCRGLPPRAFPRAESIHESSKFRRYYWRELLHEKLRRAAHARRERGQDASSPWTKLTIAERIALDAAVERDLRLAHARAPTYTMSELSQDDVLKECNVEVVALKATYSTRESRRALVLHEADEVSVEEFVRRHFEAQGCQVLLLESRPWHALFAIFLWYVVNDSSDPRAQISMFGDRRAFDRRETGEVVWTHLPGDFGSAGYGERRRDAMLAHFDQIKWEREFLLWAFEYWTPHGDDLRNYLWAHDDEVLRRARRLVETIEPTTLRRALEYLFANYWGRFLGWPDLIVFKGTEYFLAEVKSSKDRLSGEQKRWILDNHRELHLPFKLIKVHRANPKRHAADRSERASA